MTATWGIAERTDLSQHIRDLTPEEIETFRREGVVDAPGFVSPELVAEVKFLT